MDDAGFKKGKKKKSNGGGKKREERTSSEQTRFGTSYASRAVIDARAPVRCELDISRHCKNVAR